MLAFTIAFADATDRRQVMTERLGGLGFDVVFIDAVRGADIKPADKAHYISDKRRYYANAPFQDNALGCALSHHKAWQALIDSGADYGLIFEDDALPLIDKEAMAAITAQLAAHAQQLDVVFLAMRRQNRPRQHIASLGASCRLSVLNYHDFGSEAYFITKAAAQKLLAHREKQMFEIDCLMHHWWRHDCQIVHLDPPVFTEDGRSTTIGYAHKQGWPDESGMARVMLAGVRRWNRWRDSLAKRVRFGPYKAAIKARLEAR